MVSNHLYRARYHARHRTSGHLFGGRYKAVLVDADEPRYLRTLLDYLLLNPGRAGLVRLREGERLLDYPWSSLRAYARARAAALALTVMEANPRSEAPPRSAQFSFSRLTPP